jgi:hypothetical protein
MPRAARATRKYPPIAPPPPPLEEPLELELEEDDELLLEDELLDEPELEELLDELDGPVYSSAPMS